MCVNIWWWPLWVVLLCGSLCHATPTDEDTITFEQESNHSVVVQHSSPCSSTCGLGIRVQQVCPLGGGECYQRQVKCVDTWQCGMRTLTVPTGGRVELDCFGEVMATMGSFSFMVSWRFARGIVTTDESLFSRLAVPQLAQLRLEPLQEKHAGTYRCDVLDKNYRRLKCIYYGLKVLPPELLQLDFASALEEWDKVPVSNGSQPSVLTSRGLRGPLFISLTVTVATAALLLILYLWDVLRRPGESSSARERPRREEYLLLENLHRKDIIEEQISLGPLSVIQDYLTRSGLADTVVVAEMENEAL